MKLSEFILHDMEAILVQWEAFARTMPIASSLDALALRDHAEQILIAICKDIDLDQTTEAQSRKSRGLAAPLNAFETAAQTHALLRARGGFDINQMAAEYRALRASVLSLWATASGPDGTDLAQTIRFNEAVDQALCESIAFFSAEVNRGRDLLLGMLGHDMRNPLNAIQLTALYLSQLNAGAAVSTASATLIKSGARMKALLDDLTDFSRTQLGAGINVVAAPTDLALVFEEQVNQVRAAHPGRRIELLRDSGDVTGSWDANRLHQVLGNLLVNALNYGSPESPVRVRLSGLEKEVVFSIHNQGEEIAHETLDRMFAPLARGQGLGGEDGNMGLGLYICREIVFAHGGEIASISDPTGTTFTVRLPRWRNPGAGSSSRLAAVP